MSPTQIRDEWPAVAARFDELSATTAARRLAEVSIGPTSLWDALRYDVADALFDEVYRECDRQARPQVDPSFEARAGGASDARGRVTQNLWQAQVGQELLVGLLSARFSAVGDLLEAGISAAVRRRRATAGRVDVLVTGSLYRAAVASFGPTLLTLRRQHALSHLVVAHDDVLLRHGRAFTRAGLTWRHAATFPTRRHRIAAEALGRQVQAVLADLTAAQRAVLPGDTRRRCLSERAVRRLLVNFLAAEEALARCDPAVVVLPDERQPLARLVGLGASQRGLPVVSAPLARDQFYRKTPLWNGVVSTRVLASSPVASRFMGRAGASRRVFERVGGLTSEAENPASRSARRLRWRQMLGVAGNTRIVLFASQGKPFNAVLLPMVTRCIEALPIAALVIRPHPDEWPPLLRLMNPRAIVSRSMAARDALRAADLLITHSSFMAVEAALVGCPVVLLSPDPVPHLLPLITEGLAQWVRAPEDLRRAVRDGLAEHGPGLGAAHARFAADHAKIWPVDRTAESIADLARGPAAAARVPAGVSE